MSGQWVAVSDGLARSPQAYVVHRYSGHVLAIEFGSFAAADRAARRMNDDDGTEGGDQ